MRSATFSRSTSEGISAERHPAEVGEVAGPGLSERAWWTLVGLLLIAWAIRLLGAATVYPGAAAGVIGFGGWGLATVVLSWARRSPGTEKRRSPSLWTLFSVATALVVVAALLTWAVVQVRANPSYGTDEIAFDQYAAQLALHGINPYVHSMRPAFPLFNVSPDGYTYMLSGAPVTTLSYPALAFLLYVPFLALGWSTQLAVALNVAGWAVATLLAFVLLPRPLRPAALVLGSVAAYASYAVGGVTDMLYLPFLTLAAYRFTRFGRSRLALLSPLAFGLAMAIKQTPWIVLPFVLLALFLDESHVRGAFAGLRRALSYLGLVLVAFLVPNLAYLVASPRAFVDGILTPLRAHLVPAGQGVVGLSLFLRLGGGSLARYSVLLAAVTLCLLVLYVTTYPRLLPLTFVLPAVVLFFASRSFGSYLVCLVPPMLVSAVTTEGAERSRAPARHRRVARRRQGGVVGASLVVVALVFVWTLRGAAPIEVAVTGIRTTGQLATVEQISLRVKNTSSTAVRPAFSVDEGGSFTTFWLIAAGPRRLAPDSTAHYRIASPNFPAQPSIAGGFQVTAFTSHPAAVAAAAPYVPSALHVGLTPQAVNVPVSTGRRIVVHAQLLDQFDRPVHRANVPVFLGQIIYDERGLVFSEAVINKSPPGQTPVEAYTNSRGIATFNVTGTQAGANPVYFEANLVNSAAFYPYGYSNILPIRFVSPPSAPR